MTDAVGMHVTELRNLLVQMRDAADLAFASADVAPEHTGEYDAVVARVDALLSVEVKLISVGPADC